jgi:hypothetical protein
VKPNKPNFAKSHFILKQPTPMTPKKVTFGLEIDKDETLNLLYSLRFAVLHLVKDSEEKGKLPPKPKELKELARLEKKLRNHFEVLQLMEIAVKKSAPEPVKKKPSSAKKPRSKKA